MLLHVTAQAGPLGLRAAERGQVVEVGHALRRAPRIRRGSTCRFRSACRRRARSACRCCGRGRCWKEPLREGAHGRDAGAGGDEDGIGDGLLQHEVAVGTVELNNRTDGQVGQVGEVIGEEAILHAVDAQLELVADWAPKRWSRRGSAACRSRPERPRRRTGRAGKGRILTTRQRRGSDSTAQLQRCTLCAEDAPYKAHVPRFFLALPGSRSWYSTCGNYRSPGLGAAMFVVRCIRLHGDG